MDPITTDSLGARAKEIRRKRASVILNGVKQRCNNPNRDAYAWYGGRGIECRFGDVDELIAHIGLPPDAHELDRIDNDGHYEKGNVRWVTHAQNMQNCRSPQNCERRIGEAECIQIYELRGKGATYRRIGELMGITHTHARDICVGRRHLDTWLRFRAKLVA